jgi:hypothetical protein
MKRLSGVILGALFLGFGYVACGDDDAGTGADCQVSDLCELAFTCDVSDMWDSVEDCEANSKAYVEDNCADAAGVTVCECGCLSDTECDAFTPCVQGCWEEICL